MSRELDIIARIARLIEAQDEAQGNIAASSAWKDDLKDDAFWEPATRQIITTDMLVENQHFNMDYFSPEDLGWKAAAVNISDIAGMGGQLKYLLISLGLPAHVDLDWIEHFYRGLLSACKQFNGRLIGGDTVGSEHIVLNVTAIGECQPNHQVGRRTQAQAGDYIIATGFHGLSEVGLRAFQGQKIEYPAAKAAHLRPQPRIQEGQFLSGRFERYALMDSSDGLADALIKIAQASEKKLVAHAAKIPLHPEVQGYARATGQNPIDLALYGGEDFQLVGTVPAMDAELLARFHVLGRVEEPDGEPGAWLEFPGKADMQPLSLERTYQHFSGESHP